MAYQIPYTDGTFTPPDDIIPGNSTAEHPVVFHLSPVQGADRARLRSILFATGSLADSLGDWSPDMQNAVIAAYGKGGELFMRCVDKVEGLTVPGKMAKRALIIPPDKHDTVPDAADIPIRTGTDFAMISGYVLSLSFLVAMEVAKMSNLLEGMDRRLFGSPSGSRSTGTPGPTPGTAGRAKRGRGRRGTAA
jgi:hypothetical protein